MGHKEAPLPHVVGRYALYGEIATGGMASVHYGRLLGPAGFSKTVAIKRLHPHLARDRDFAAMFLDEARLAARVSHPNVVPMLDVVELADEVLLVMEYVPGASLTTLIRAAIARGAPVPPDVAAAIVRGVLLGLHAAHEATDESGAPLGMVHRDVSPQNVQVGADGVPRVLDFGVAKAEGRLHTTRDGQLKGKLAYMSPEQLRGEADRRTDVYAAAVLLWETLTSERLFAGDNEGVVVTRVLAGAVAAPSARAPGVPASLDAITLKGLAHDPADRFATARDMALAIEGAVAIASSTKVAAWVEDLAGDALRRRAGDVAEVENLSAPAAAGTPSGPRGRADDETQSALAPPLGGGGPASAPAGARRAGRPWALLALVALSAAGLAAGGMRLWGRRAEAGRAAPAGAPSPSAVARPRLPARVIVLGIENRTGDPIFDGSLDVVFAAALARSNAIQAFSSERFNLLAEAGSERVDEALARALALRDHDTVVTVRGVVAPVGADYALSITALDAATGAAVLSESRAGVAGPRVVPTLGRLACRLRAALGDSPPEDAALAEQTGLSPKVEADYEFIVGRGLARSGKLLEGIGHLRRAVALDPGFSHAHAGIGVNLRNLGRRIEGRDEIRRARETSDGLSDRDQLGVLAYSRAAEEDYAGAAAAYEELLRRFPDDERAETALPGVYQAMSRADLARDLAARAVLRHPGKVFELTNQAVAELFASHVEAGAELARAALEKSPNPLPHAFACAAMGEALLGHAAEARELWGKLAAKDAALSTAGLADLALSEGRPADAVRALSAGLARGDDATGPGGATLRAMLAEAKALAGDRAGALAMSREAEREVVPDLPELAYLAAVADIASGKPKRARAASARLAETQGQDHATWAALVDAEARLADGEPRDALASIEAAERVVDSWLGHLDRARAHLALAEYDRALAELGTCNERRGEGAFALGLDAPSVRFVTRLPYYVARALEGQGRKEARAMFEAYAAARPGAEHDPLVDDARARAGRR